MHLTTQSQTIQNKIWPYDDRDLPTLTVRDFNTILSDVTDQRKPKISKDIKKSEQHNDLMHIFRTLHPAMKGQTFFSSTRVFTRSDHIKPESRFQQYHIKTISYRLMCSDHEATDSEITNKKM